MKEAAPCQGRSHLCQSNRLLLLELVIGVDAPGHLSGGSFCRTGTLGPPGRSGAFGSVAGGMSGLLRSDGKSQVPFEENGDLAKKGVGRCFIGSVGVTATCGAPVLNQSHLWLCLAPITGRGSWTWHFPFPNRRPGGNNRLFLGVAAVSSSLPTTLCSRRVRGLL